MSWDEASETETAHRLIHAYLDDELPPEKRAEVEQLLAERPDLRGELEAWAAQKALLREAVGAAARQLSPPSAPAPRAPSRWSALTRIAASLALLAAGAAGGWLARDSDDVGGVEERAARSPLAREALLAHSIYTSDRRRPVELLAKDKAHLDKWLSNRVGRKIAAPDLSGAGLSFVGGRLVEAQGRPAALFVYRHADGARASLLVVAADRPEPASRLVRGPGSVKAYAWSQGEVRMVLAAAGSAKTLERAALLSRRSE